MDVMTSKQVQTLVRNAIQKSERQTVMELTSYFEQQLNDLRMRIEQLENQLQRGTAPEAARDGFIDGMLDGLGKRSPDPSDAI